MRLHWILFGALLFAGCGRETGERPIATINGEPVTAAELAVEMQRQPDRDTALEQLLDRKRMVAAARASGLAENPEVRRALDTVLINHLLEAQLQPQLDAINVTDEEVRRYYDEHPQEFVQAGSVTFAMLFRASRPEDAARRQQHRAALETAIETARTQQLPVSEGFGAVAVESSEDQASRYRGGIVGPFTAGGDYAPPIPELLEAAEQLQPGEISPIIDTPRGLYVVRLVERTASAPVPFEAVQQRLRRQLMGKREAALRAQFIEKLRQRYPAE